MSNQGQTGVNFPEIVEAIRDLGKQNAISDALRELNRFPQLPAAREVGGAVGAPGAGDGSRVDAAIGEVLGWRLRANDPKGFLAALSQSFELTEIDGHRQATWKPRTVNIQADLGTITGAQASLYVRSRATVDQAIPILDRLTPLEAAADREELEASRSIVRLKLTELVREFGLESGPRVVRVDEIFDTLLGPATTTPVAGSRVGGELGRLGERFGFRRAEVLTVQEETSLTDYLVLLDYVTTLRASWGLTKVNFLRRISAGGERFLGTQLVVLSRALAVIAETVDEVSTALDSVFVGPAERELLLVGLEETALTVAEGLRWVREFATEEGPRLLEGAGKEALMAFRTTLDHLSAFVTAAADDPAVGKRSVRVEQSLRDLATAIAEAKAATEGILPEGPRVTRLSVIADQTLLIVGSGFRTPAVVSFLVAPTPVEGPEAAPSPDVASPLPQPALADEVTVLGEAGIIAHFPGDVLNRRGTVQVNVDGREATQPFIPPGSDVK